MQLKKRKVNPWLKVKSRPLYKKKAELWLLSGAAGSFHLSNHNYSMNISPCRYLRFYAGCLAGVVAGSSVSAQHYQQVVEKLDTDGNFVAYIDFSGDAVAFGDHLTAIYTAVLENNPDMMPVPLDFASVLSQLGFDGLLALGYSSSEVETGLYRNRGVTLSDGELRGLMALTDPTPRSFRSAQMAPPKASLVADFSLNLNETLQSVTQVATSVMGPMGEGFIQMGLGQPLLPTGLNGFELIEVLSNPITMILVQDVNFSQQDAELEFYLEIENGASLLPHLVELNQINPNVTVETIGDEIVVDLSAFLQGAGFGLFAKGNPSGGTLTLHSGDTMLAMMENEEKLAQSEAFQRVASRLPEEAAAFVYQAGTDMDPLFEMLKDGDPQIRAYLPAIEIAYERIFKRFMDPQATASWKDGNYFISESYGSFSFKDVAVAIPVVVVGLVTAAAIPAIQQMRGHGNFDYAAGWSEEDQIEHNLMILYYSAQQYMLEEGVEEAAFHDLVGPDKLIGYMESVMGESYDDLVIRLGDEAITVLLPDGREVSFYP